MPGHGRRSVRAPPPSSTIEPSFFTTAASTPGNGLVAEPGFVSVMPGSGVIMMWPVSVCHQVSTIGQRPPPTTFQYHSHAFGLIGSPTDPSSRSLSRLCLVTYSAPHFMHARIAVGAV